jgi:signal transduction histidine kinase
VLLYPNKSFEKSSLLLAVLLLNTKRKNNELEKKLAAITRGLDIQASLEKIRARTGLRLCLTYDILKAQAGEIKVESEEGEGSEFVIQLPLP